MYWRYVGESLTNHAKSLSPAFSLAHAGSYRIGADMTADDSILVNGKPAGEMILDEETARANGVQLGDVLSIQGHKYVVQEMGPPIKCVLVK